MRSIKPGVADGGMTQVDGINPGDVVANSSFDKLQDNLAVVVSNQASNQASNASNSASTKTAAAGTNGSSTP
jgi:multidrug efflux system membrane fusion protein